MIVPISWLNEYIDGPTDAQELAEKFTFIGYMLDHPVYQVGDDYILDLEVRQNRSDCLSLIGLARELGAVIDKHVMMPQILDLSNVSSGKTKINIENAELCYRFNTLTISNIENKQSPDWMKKKLESYGIKSINALVDITNYVMIELGQPLHAFDAHKISNKELTIRTARENETITLLGNKSVNLTQDDLIIADASGPIAIAGIMGGDEKGISESTTEIILEAATYSQANIRRSTIRHDIRTEASTRLEKFLHPDLTELALSRAAQLIKDVIGGEIVDHSDQYPHHFEEKNY
jgi:phenylalanyl-tRNA synthetase beta chain